jgi:3-oxoadipate enol-lactonase
LHGDCSKTLKINDMIAPISSSQQLSYIRAGDFSAPKLVFLHAFPLSNQMWYPQIEEFSSDFDCIAPNFRGIGESTPFETKPSFAMIADDIKLLLDHLQIFQKVILCGLSMGGYCAFEFLRAFPDRVSKLILCDTRPDADSEEARKTRNDLLEFTLRNNAIAVADKMLPKLLGRTTTNEKPEVSVRVHELASPHRPEHLAALIQALRDRRDSTDLLPKIKIPTLVISGEEDEISTPEIMRDMASHIPNAKFVEIEKSGHLSNLENTPLFNKALQDFLGK